VLTLDRMNCTACSFNQPGTMSTVLPCPTNGKGPKGGRDGCRTCHGSRRHYDHETRVPCSQCGGAYERAAVETFTDSAPREAILTLAETLTVVRQDRAGTWNEAYLGIGSLWSCSDYGRAWERPDEELVAEIRERLTTERVQACKIVQPYERVDTDARLVDRLVIVLHRDGYLIVAVTD
jgi:hypothetical protein